jgi:DnaJ-class molecular chaperone
MTRQIHKCRFCDGHGTPPSGKPVNQRGVCSWCNGTGDEDYQDRAYEESRDYRDDGKDDWDD